ncbi:lysylphosphatidylglycerol synthase transmembrane domain-containing protein [Actinoplanes sp. HUAS TT8]|uniref:lysylphosphatidylglycerol synthase transmembrane domain-containing protein n=1 Tax=Actinoplanes sp. HUAS TT8 TaxID=3447453 RepID=UPI003F51CEC9
MILVAVAAVWVTVRGRLPAPGAIWTILRTADARWVAAALGVQVVSQAAFALQQRHLLAAVGVRVSRVAILAITYSRSAISLALPAGSAMSAAYAVQQYRRRGATGATAATVAVISMLASMAGLLAVCVLAFGQGPLLNWWHSASYEAIAAAVVVTGALVAVVRAGGRTPKSVDPDLNRSDRDHVESISVMRRAGAWIHREWTAAVTAARSIPPRDAAAALLWSALNWAADAFCLVAAAQACGLPAGWQTVGAAYLVAQVVRQIPLSPGGLGFVEASLVTALSLGASPAAAAAAVLLYRIVSFWLILPVGLLTYLGLRRVPARSVDLPVTPVLPRPRRAELAESSH